MIRTESLSKRYGRREALERVSLEVPEARVFALTGPNGAGKSTLIKIVMSLVRASAGSAEVFGVDSRRLNAKQLEQIGYYSENQTSTTRPHHRWRHHHGGYHSRDDERIARLGLLRRLLLKPELGALIGAVLIFVFFASLSDIFWSFSGVANWLDLASNPIGIMAVAVALLMIGGHFDLSAGTLVGTSGLTTAILTINFHTVIWVAMLGSLVLCLGRRASSTGSWSSAPACRASSSP